MVVDTHTVLPLVDLLDALDHGPCDTLEDVTGPLRCFHHVEKNRLAPDAKSGVENTLPIQRSAQAAGQLFDPIALPQDILKHRIAIQINRLQCFGLFVIGNRRAMPDRPIVGKVLKLLPKYCGHQTRAEKAT